MPRHSKLSYLAQLLMILLHQSVVFIKAKEEATSVLEKYIYVPGDVILGGLFTIHIMSSKVAATKGPLKCNGEFSRRAFQAVEAMLLAVENVNKNSRLLPGIRLGVDIKDTCGTVDFAVKGSLNFSFVRKYFERSSSCLGTSQRTPQNDMIRVQKPGVPETVAIIGPDLSDIARAVSDLAGLFYVPVVSHSATSPIFSDRARFKYFLRTIPSDTLQVELIVELLMHFKWTYIILLTSDDEYGRSGRVSLRIRLNSVPIPTCTVIDEAINFENTKHLVSIIKQEKRAKVVIVFGNIKYVKDLIQESKRQSLTGYTWIASDAWSGAKMVTEGNEDILVGMLGVNPMPSSVPSLQQHLSQHASGKARSVNVWMDDFRAYERKHCTMEDISQCINSPSYELSPYIASTMDAVFAVAHGIHNMLRCNETSCQVSLENAKWDKLIDFLENVTFSGISGNQVSFRWYGSGLSKYQIKNFVKEKSDYVFKNVGCWEGDILRNNSPSINISSEIYWTTGKAVPKSTCSKTCHKGQRKKPESQHPTCCWTCVDCGGNTISNQSNTDMCLPCLETEWPSKDKSICLPIQNMYLSWKDSWVKVLISLSIFNIILVFITFGIFIAKRNTAVVRASSRSLCYILLFGVILFYLLPFFMIDKPTQISCKYWPFALGLCFAVNVGTMLVKTNRIARIFSRKLMKTRRARFLSDGWQYLMVSLIVCLELFLCLLWVTALTPPEVALLPYISKEYKVLACSYRKSTGGLAIWSTFNAGLVIICTYQAFLVRKVSSNYNEAKFIALTMITMCIIIIVFVPVYVGTVSYSREIICSFLYIFAGFVEFASIFGPKLYIIILRPEKNVPMRQKIDGMRRLNSPRSSYTSGCDTETPPYFKVQRDGQKVGKHPKNGIVNNLVLTVNDTEETFSRKSTEKDQLNSPHGGKVGAMSDTALAIVFTTNPQTLRRILSFQISQRKEGLDRHNKLSRSESSIAKIFNNDTIVMVRENNREKETTELVQNGLKQGSTTSDGVAHTSLESSESRHSDLVSLGKSLNSLDHERLFCNDSVRALRSRSLKGRSLSDVFPLSYSQRANERE